MSKKEIIEQLTIATENLYKAFAKYHLTGNEESCSCCVSASDRQTLHAKPLRELQDENLSRYAFKAMSTWGDANMFKHYLPRIYELAAKGELIVDDFVILNKLEDANWHEWENQEVETVKIFLKKWWAYQINCSKEFDIDLLHEINKRVKNIDELLSLWDVSFDTIGFKNLFAFIQMDYYWLKIGREKFEQFSESEVRTLIAFVESKIPQLEEAFFHYDYIDPDFSKQISDTIYTLERL